MCLLFKLEQMDLLVKESDVSVRAKLHNRVISYRAELHRLAKDFARAKCTVNIDLGSCHRTIVAILFVIFFNARPYLFTQTMIILPRVKTCLPNKNRGCCTRPSV